MRLTIPSGHESSVVIASVSGGKDSAGLACALRESGIEARYVFSDTGWEADETYEYLGTIERVLGIVIERVGVPGGMIAKSDYGLNFPSRLRKWCTDELKLAPIRAYHDRVGVECDADTINAVGIRAEESEARSKMPTWEYSDEWKGYVWRPLLDWTLADVLAAHHRHGLPVNPLYARGHSRVGCYPCIFSRKEEIELIAKHAPERIDLIEALEASGTAERALRNVDREGRYKIEEATFFQRAEAVFDEGGAAVMTDAGRQKREGVPFPIREAVAWSRTSRGGVQLRLLADAPSGGCFRWGLCEPPVKSEAP